MASSRERHFRNYKFEQVPDNSKKGYKNIYTYIGDYYTWDVPDSTIKSYKLLFAICEMATIIVFVFAALQDISLNKTAYIVIPAVISICAWIFELIAVGFFCFIKFPLKEEDYKRIDSTFFLTFIIRFICLTFVSAACVVDCIRFSLGIAGAFATLGYIVCAAIAMIMKLKYKKLATKKKVIVAE